MTAAPARSGPSSTSPSAGSRSATAIPPAAPPTSRRRCASTASRSRSARPWPRSTRRLGSPRPPSPAPACARPASCSSTSAAAGSRPATTPRAITYLRRALGVDPYSKKNATALGDALAAASRWDELDRLLRHRSSVTEDPVERAGLLERRAELYGGVLDDRDALTEALTELAGLEPPYGPASEQLRQVLREDQKWAELAARIEAEVDALADDPLRQVGEVLELATIAREHLSEKDKAAELLHRALSIDPHNEEALARYADHFRERRDWRGLADLYEFALDNAREDGAPTPELVRRLEEIAQIAEIRLGDVTRAIETWQRIDELEPGNPKAREALRRLSSRAKMWEQLVGVLEQEASAAVTPAERAEALRRIAHTYRERQVEPRRAIALYEEVLGLYPDDDAVLKALAELYEREGDDAGLASTLRRQLELDARRLGAEAASSGRAGTQPREWPVAKRMERLTLLRRLAQMCETRVGDVDGVVFACAGILDILPGDRDALDRMERVLDKAGDAARLEQTLEYHAASATGPAERAKVLRRLAKLAADQGDDARALDRWEQTLRAVPTDAEALEACAELYERAGRWGELAQVLERLDGGRPAVEPGTADAAIRARELERYARVVDDELGDAARAARAWQRVLELSPKDRTALTALGRLHRAAGRWRELADVLAAEIPLYAVDEPERAATAALERAQLLDERLGAPAEAAKQLERLIADLDPTHLDAHTQLRRLHEARGDFDAAVRVAEREMYLAPEPLRKVARGLEIGFLCRDRLGDATRALQAFDRVLALDSQHDEALAAAADLHAKLGDWKAHVRALERRVGLAEGAVERRQLMSRIAQATAERLGDPKGAFSWWRRAHDEAPDASTLADLRRAADAFGLWKELADVYGDERRRLLASGAGGVPADPEAYVAASRELAVVAERRLGDRQRAMAAIHDALSVAPRDNQLLGEAERIAAEGDERPLWQLLLDTYDVVLAAQPPPAKVELHERRARILDERMDQPKAALAELMAAFAWMPEREATRDALYKLGERARSFGDLVAVEAALVARAGTDPGRISALRRKAELYEEQVKDLPRAFRDPPGHVPDRARGRRHDRPPLAPGPRDRQVPRRRQDAQARARRGRWSRPSASWPRPRPRRPGSAPAGSRPAPPACPGARPPASSTSATSAGDLSVGDSTQPIDVDELIPAGRRDRAAGAHRGRRAGRAAAARRRRQRQRRRRAVIEPEKPARNDRTMELTLQDLVSLGPARPATAPGPTTIEATGPARADRTMELTLQDLAQMAPGAPPTAPRGLPGVHHRAPPPPPRTPSRAKSPPARIPTAPRKAQAAARRPPLPSLPVRSYESPWDEFATAYDTLPAPDTEAKLRWLFRAAEVWESGADEVGRAFVTLARAMQMAQGSPGGDGEVRARLHRLAADHEAWDRLASLVRADGRGRRHRGVGRRPAHGGRRDPGPPGPEPRRRGPVPPGPRHAPRRRGRARPPRVPVPGRGPLGRAGGVARGAHRSAPGLGRARGRAAGAAPRAGRDLHRQAGPPARRDRHPRAPAPARARRRRGPARARRPLRPGRPVEQGHREPAAGVRHRRRHARRARGPGPDRPDLRDRARAARPGQRDLPAPGRDLARRRGRVGRARRALPGAGPLDRAVRRPPPPGRADPRRRGPGPAARPPRPGPARVARQPRGGGRRPAPRADDRARRHRASPTSWSPRWSRPTAPARRSPCSRAGSTRTPPPTSGPPPSTTRTPRPPPPARARSRAPPAAPATAPRC